MSRFLSEYGRLNSSVKPYRCQCPACFRPTQDGRGCEPACDLRLCDEVLGACLPAGAVVAGGGGGSRGGEGCMGVGWVGWSGGLWATLSYAGG